MSKQDEIADAIQEVHPDAQPGDTVDLYLSDNGNGSWRTRRTWYASREAYRSTCGPVVLERIGTAGRLGPLPRWAREVTAYCDSTDDDATPILTHYRVEVPYSPLRRAVGGYYGEIYSEERLSELIAPVAWSGTVSQEERDRQEEDRAALVEDLRQAWRDDPDHRWSWVREGEILDLDPDYDDLCQWRTEAGSAGDAETVDAITAWLGGDRREEVAWVIAEVLETVEAWQDECAIEAWRAR